MSGRLSSLRADEQADSACDPSAHAARALLRRCEELLLAFPTSLEDDLAMLAARGIVPSEVNAAVAALAALDGADAADRSSTEPAGMDMPMADQDEVPPDEDAFVVALRYRAGKKLVLRAAMDWMRRRWLDEDE